MRNVIIGLLFLSLLNIPVIRKLSAEGVDIYFTGTDVNQFLTSDEVEDGEPFIDIYDPDKACNGTTIFSDTHDVLNPRIIEVNMLGEIVWEYEIPDELIQGVFIGLDVEVLQNNNVLFNISNSGIYEIDRMGNIVWSHDDLKNSHDADRLSNGNTIYIFGNDDTRDDAQVKEVRADGGLAWEWFAKEEYDVEPFDDIFRQGWTHANAVTRLSNGNTLISLRNFNLTVEVGREGKTVWSFDWRSLGGSITDPHEPEIQPNDNLLVCMQRESPFRAVEINRTTGEIEWSYSNNDLRTARDADRLPNGNTLIVAVLENGTKDDLDDDESVIFELTEEGAIVWQLRLKNSPVGSSPGVFYKAQRICENADAEPSPTPTPDSGDDNDEPKSFTFECSHEDLIDGITGIKKLVLGVGENETCTIKLTNLAPGVPVEVSTSLRPGARSAIIVSPESGVTDANGELEFTISAIRNGIDWIAWAVNDDKGEFEFNKRAYDQGIAWGMFVEVK